MPKEPQLSPVVLRRLRMAFYPTMFVMAGFVVAGPFGGYVAQAIDPPTAVVDGTVFEDRNGNGSHDVAEPVIPGVTVSDGATITQTDAQGRYRIETGTDRRLTDLVFINQPAGYVVPTDEFMTPTFYRNLGELADNQQKTADFALTKDRNANGSNFSFGNIGDPHVNSRLADQIREINSTSRNLGFVQVSGDLTNSATDAEFNKYKAGTAASEIPVWPAVGNHEYFSGGGSDYASRIDNYRRHVGPEWYSFDYGDRHFLVLENNGSAPFEEQLDWARRDLELNVGDKKLVVLTHKPMNVPFGSPSEYDAYGDLLEKYDAELILVGHEHSNDVEPDSEFVPTAKHIQTNSSSYTIDNSPRGFRYVHMTDASFENPFRMYGADQTMTITSPAPGTSIPVARFPGIQVNAYDTADEVTRARYRIDGGSWHNMKPTGEFTWHENLTGPAPEPGGHTVEVEATDEGGKTWSSSSAFTFTDDPAIVPTAGADWEQHHGDRGHTGVAKQAQEPGRRLAWSYRTEGTFLTGSPVIVDGVVYAGTRDEDGTTNSDVHAVDLATGKRLWKFDVPSSVTGSLAVADGTVFVPSLRGSLFAVDAKTGELRWQRDPEDVPEPNTQRAYGYYSPAVAEGKVFWPYQTRLGKASQGLLVALDIDTGKAVWESPMSGATMSDGIPAIADGKVFVGNETADRVIAYDLETGAREWLGSARLGGWQDGVPTAAGGRVFIGSNNGVIARDAKTGADLWSFRSPHPSQVSSGSTPSAPAVDGDIVYMGFPSGAVTALDARTGVVLWDRALPDDGPYAGGISSSPVVAGDTLFVGSNNGKFYALDRSSGQPLWQHEIGTWVSAGPAVSGNTVVTGAWDGNLYAYTDGGEAAEPWASVSGAVSDPGTGDAVDGAKVVATRGGEIVATTNTGQNGGYVLKLETGSYDVSASKRGFLAGPGSTASVEVGETGDTTRALTLTEVTSPVAWKAEVPPDFGSSSTRLDVLAGDSYHSVMNDRIQASIVDRVGGNNQAGTFQPGWLADLALTDGTAQETLDWSELIVSPQMNNPGVPWGRSGEWLTLGDVGLDGASVVASGSAQVDPKLKTTVRYKTLPNAPIVKMTLEIENTGASAFAGYFQYLLDPDSSSDVAHVPGVSNTNPGFLTSGWTGNYLYVGANQPNGSPAHAIAWADDEPTGLSAFGYIAGAWFDASVPAGGTKEISWYHIIDYPADGQPATNVARWAAQIELLDP